MSTSAPAAPTLFTHLKPPSPHPNWSWLRDSQKPPFASRLPPTSSVVSPAYAVVSVQRSWVSLVLHWRRRVVGWSLHCPCWESMKWRHRHKSPPSEEMQRARSCVSFMRKWNRVQKALTFCHRCVSTFRWGSTKNINYLNYSICLEECWTDLHGVSLCISFSKSVWRVCRTRSMLAWVSMTANSSI